MNGPSLLPALLALALCQGGPAAAAWGQENGQDVAPDYAEPSGTLRAEDGRLLRSGVSGDAGLSGELRAGNESIVWIEEGGQLMLRYYNGDGRLVRVERYEKDELRSIETHAWQGARLSLITREDIRQKTRTREAYNDRGLLVREEAYSGERLLFSENRHYDDEGRLISIARDEGNVRTVNAPGLLIERSYAADGSLAREKRTQDGLTELVSVWTAPGDYMEEHYDKGILFARVYFRSNTRYREEIIQGGIVVRERIF